jgi:hypothetical protein
MYAVGTELAEEAEDASRHLKESLAPSRSAVSEER